MNNWWSVQVETRLLGALGVFKWRTYTVKAEPHDIARFALEDAHLDGYETRGVGVALSVRPPR